MGYGDRCNNPQFREREALRQAQGDRGPRILAALQMNRRARPSLSRPGCYFLAKMPDRPVTSIGSTCGGPSVLRQAQDERGSDAPKLPLLRNVAYVRAITLPPIAAWIVYGFPLSNCSAAM